MIETTSTIILSLILIIPFIISFLTINSVILNNNTSLIFIKSFLSLGFGCGISSIFFFITIITFGNSFIYSLLLETVILLFLISYLYLNYYKQTIYYYRNKYDVKLLNANHWARWIRNIFWVALFLSVASFIIQSAYNPHGAWDAFAIWNTRARYLFRAGEQWSGAFSTFYSHPDYPIMLPLFIAICWRYLGSDTVIIPIIIGLIFTYSIVGIVVCSVTYCSTASQGYLAGLVLLGTNPFISSGLSQYADIPLSFYFLTTIVLLTLKCKLSFKHGAIALAGIAAGLAAWTKNEGILFLVVIISSFFFLTWTYDGWKQATKDILVFIVGLIPVLTCIIYFKIIYASGNDIIVGQGFHSTLARLTDFSRYAIIMKKFLNEIYFFHVLRDNKFDIPMTIILFMGIFLLKRPQKLNANLSLKYAIISLCLMLIGYFFVYVITPNDLTWHINTSLQRLLVHLWPSLVFIFFLSVRNVEEPV